MNLMGRSSEIRASISAGIGGRAVQVAWVVGDPVPGVQMGGPVLEGAAEDQRTLEALVSVDGVLRPPGRQARFRLAPVAVSC